VLDLGCGYGRLSKTIRERRPDIDVVGQDVSISYCKLFSDSERVALEYAERITCTDQQVDDAFFAEARKHFTEPQLVELTAAIAFENFRSKLNPTLGVEAQGFCMVPGKPHGT